MYTALSLCIQCIFFLIFTAIYYKLFIYKRFALFKALVFAFDAGAATFLISVFLVKKWAVYILDHTWKFYAYYAALSLLVGAVLLGLAALHSRIIRRHYETNAPKSSVGATVMNVVWTMLAIATTAVAALAFFVPRWFSAYFGHVSLDQFIFLLTTGSKDTPVYATAQIYNYMVVPVISTVLIGAQLALWTPRWWKRLIGFVAMVVAAVLSVFYAFSVLPLADFGKLSASSSFLEEQYVDPRGVVTFPEQKRNLIRIYMESVENSYYDKSNGGYDENNLMPELLEISNEATSIHFSNNELMGGPHQTFGASHSAAGMINMEAGVPMLTSLEGGTAHMSYPDFPTIGDLLEEQGYVNEFILGSDAAWGDLGRWWENHGNFKVFDHQYAIEQGLIPSDYAVWWGFEDDKLYEWSKTELTALAQTGKPFYAVIENADTHFPDGYKSALMTEEPFDSQYANVIHYSQKETVKLIRWIQAQPWYENTTIVVTGDHRSMDTTFFQGWDPNYERTIVNFIINPAIEKSSTDRTQNRDFAPFDIFPTVLASLGATIKGNRAGIGTNLYSNVPTLVEQYGLDEVNTQLTGKSLFYFQFAR